LWHKVKWQKADLEVLRRRNEDLKGFFDENHDVGNVLQRFRA